MVHSPVSSTSRRRSCALILGLILGAAACARQATGVPEAVIAKNILGTAFLGQQKWTEAEAAFKRALAERPQDPLLLTNAAVAIVQLGRGEEAEGLLRKALASAPDYAPAHYNLGLLHDSRGEFEAAAGHFAEVARTDPDDLFTQYYLGSTWTRLGRDEEAEQALRAALRRDPTHVSSLYALGRLLLKRGDQDEGTQLITRSQQIRARSGLDEAVGSQYGEQGPYALGMDYPGDALAAPTMIPVRLTAPPNASDLPNVRAWTLSRGASGEPVLIATDARGGLWRLTPEGGAENLVSAAEEAPRIVALVAADIDNDRQLELVVLRHGGIGADRSLSPALIRLGSASAVPIVESLGFASEASDPIEMLDPDAVDLVAFDRDHDGDVDLVWCFAVSSTADCRVATNDGTGRFIIRPSAEHGFGLPPGAGAPITLAFSDVDNDRDVDLLIGGPAGLQVLLNQRDGTFVDAAPAPPVARGGLHAFVVADLDKDGFMDLITPSPEGPLLWKNRLGSFLAPRPLAARKAQTDGGTATIVVADIDNDGFLDVLQGGWNASGTIWRNLGAGNFEEVNLGLRGDDLPLVAFDADRDGDLDLAVLAGDALRLLHNDGGNVQRHVAFDARGVGDNRFGIGTKLEVLSGGLRQKFEITQPVPLHVGLGARSQVQSARCLWPSGVLQDEVELAAGGTIELTQLDRKGTSCPLLYAWRDGGWHFITDFLGGCAIGYQHAPGVLNEPDTDEYVLIPDGLEPDASGGLRLRLNNQLEEVIWFDQVELLVVDHPADVAVYPNERLMPGPPWPEFALFASSDVRAIAAALSVEDGQDVTELLAAADRRWVEGFALLPFKGYAESHTLELDLGPLPDRQRIVLLLDGWIDYADSTANIAASQAGVALSPPRLAVSDGRGGFREVPGRMGFPAGLPKTIAVDLSGAFPTADRRLRLTTNMRIYWDRARVMVGGERTSLEVTRLAPMAAELRFGGYPRETSPDGRRPFAYDPKDVTPTYPWKAHVGAYTAFGDVTELLAGRDDRLVTTRHGDEIELQFAGPSAPAPGRSRTYLLYADGFGKDMDPNSAAGTEVGPVPFHGMPLYPYPEGVTPPPSAVKPPARPPRLVLPSAAGWPGAPTVPRPSSLEDAR